MGLVELRFEELRFVELKVEEFLPQRGIARQRGATSFNMIGRRFCPSKLHLYRPISTLNALSNPPNKVGHLLCKNKVILYIGEHMLTKLDSSVFRPYQSSKPVNFISFPLPDGRRRFDDVGQRLEGVSL